MGAALALWVIGYGFVQAFAPAHVGGEPGNAMRPPPDAQRLLCWTAGLLLPLGGILAGLGLGAPALPTLVIGLLLFGVTFATNSAMHSYLIVSYADRDRVAMSVGWYYMANAAGRLVGTLLSGVLFQVAGQGENGLLLCVGGSTAFVCVSALLCKPLRRAEQRSAVRTSG